MRLGFVRDLVPSRGRKGVPVLNFSLGFSAMNRDPTLETPEGVVMEDDASPMRIPRVPTEEDFRRRHGEIH